jgi:hypothetical protein
VDGVTGLGVLLPSKRRDRPGVGHPGGRQRCQAGLLVRAAAQVPGRPPGCGAAQYHTVDKGISHKQGERPCCPHQAVKDLGSPIHLPVIHVRTGSGLADHICVWADIDVDSFAYLCLGSL